MQIQIIKEPGKEVYYIRKNFLGLFWEIVTDYEGDYILFNSIAGADDYVKNFYRGKPKFEVVKKYKI